MKASARMSVKRTGFTLIEIMVVVLIISIMVGIAMVTFARSRPTVRIRNDAAQTLSFIRNMWDRTRATGAPLILSPNYEDGSLSYVDPRFGKEEKAQFSKGTVVVGILVNDRFHNADSASALPPVQDGAEGGGEGERLEEYAYADVIYISEGRGLTRVAVVFAILADEGAAEPYTDIHVASLNLITGKGRIGEITAEELSELMSKVTYDESW